MSVHDELVKLQSEWRKVPPWPYPAMKSLDQSAFESAADALTPLIASAAEQERELATSERRYAELFETCERAGRELNQHDADLREVAEMAIRKCENVPLEIAPTYPEERGRAAHIRDQIRTIDADSILREFHEKKGVQK